ncbi:CubicO group peptidase, beta-lactamase class C family [Amycolatopsis xylanica]|uniref:CubicO group peptidase, beta-lactamase class C family n=1 Tax=Amycolatopsis xylanica TaxID=589385 RepID=A0A1H2WGD7_9PSEU|nr:serine hydrolase domain-containing protein [Amycolatopsis xylanica]SDW79578.1 CubicO group peptidase, beta-lactamase class C family [Amycolatopsis xylanica]
MITSNELADRLSRLARKFTVTGASAALWHDGTLARGEAGTVNVVTGAPVLPGTLFAAGSVTKVLTASLAMTLVDEGRLDLDAPVPEYLPGFTTADPGRSAAITVRMLLNHSSGLPGNYLPNLDPGDDVLERLMRELATLAVTGVPGRRFSYSNMGMSTLGRLVETITAERFDIALSTRVLRPLGMVASADAEELLLHSTAVGHVVDPASGAVSRVPRLRVWPEYGPAGSRLWLDVESLIRFGRMHIDGRTPDGHRLLSLEALEQMRTPQYDDFWGCLRACANFGLGWGIFREGDDPVLTHSGANLGMHSTLYVIPRRNVVLAVLTNSTTGALLHSALCTELLDEFFDARGPAAITLPESIPEVDTERFTGLYRAPDGEVSVEVRDGRLHARLTPDPGLAEWDRLMGSLTGGGQALPLTCVDSERDRFVIDAGTSGNFVPVQFSEPDLEERPTLVRLGTLYERTP